MAVEIIADITPGIVPMLLDNNSEATQQLSSANCDTCYEACDSTGCDCFDSGDCFDSCDRAPDEVKSLIVRR